MDRNFLLANQKLIQLHYKNSTWTKNEWKKSFKPRYSNYRIIKKRKLRPDGSIVWPVTAIQWILSKFKFHSRDWPEKSSLCVSRLPSPITIMADYAYLECSDINQTCSLSTFVNVNFAVFVFLPNKRHVRVYIFISWHENSVWESRSVNVWTRPNFVYLVQ